MQTAQRRNDFWEVADKVKIFVPLVGFVIAAVITYANLRYDIGDARDRITVLELKNTEVTDKLDNINSNLASINTSLDFIKRRVEN